MASVAEFFAILGLKPDEESFNKADNLLGKVREAAGSLAGVVAGAFAVDAIVDFTRATINAIPEIGDLADQTGVAAEEIQRLGFAAQQSGSDAETLNAALGKFIGNLGAAAGGSEGVISALRRLGVSTTNIAEQDPGAVLTQVADGFAGIESVAEKARLAQDLFGLSGKKLVPFLSQGSAAIRELGDEAERLGLVLGRDTIDSVGAVDDRLNTVTGSIAAVGRSLVVTALPAIETLVEVLAAGAAVLARLAKVLRDNQKVLKVIAVFIGTVLVTQLYRLAAAWIAQGLAAISSTAILPGTFFALATALDIVIVKVTALAARFVAVAAPALALVAAGALLFLVFDDLFGALAGKDSLLVGFVGNFDKLAEVLFFAAGDEGAGFFTRAIAGVGAALALVLNIVDVAISRLFDLTGVFFSIGETIVDFFVSPLETVREVLQGLIADVSRAIATVSNGAGALLGLVSGPLGSVIGTERTQQIAAGLSAVSASDVARTATASPVVRSILNANNSVSVGAPTVNVTVSGGGDPDKIGAAVAGAVGPSLEQAIRAARIDTVPNSG